MSDNKEENKLAPFKFLGFVFERSSDNINFPTTCPFSDKEGKLYVNSETGQWISYTSDKRGNIITFLRLYYELCLEHTTEQELTSVCEDRKLPMQAIKGQIAFNPLTQKYMIPTKNFDGFVINLTSWHPSNKKPLKIPGVPVSIIGLDKLKDNDKEVYICEGEWDVIAMTWLISAVGKDAVVVGVPGATIFKDAWIGFFQRKNIVVCFDNDKAGFDGQQKIADKIRPLATKMQFLIWSELIRPKYDVRDLIIEHGSSPNYTPPKLLKLIKIVEAMLHSQTQYERDKGYDGGDLSKQDRKDLKIPDRFELEAVYQKHLKMKHTKDIAIMFGTLFANKLKGDPVWLFLVAPPGGSKTELLMTLNKSPYIETVSTLTPAALVPGMRIEAGKPDPSLLKKIDGKVLIVKDMTTMLSMQPLQRDEIFGVLRDAYDGYVEKWFATHKKSYVTHFGIIAGVTPALDAYNSIMTTMGARFINWRIGTDDTVQDHREKIKKAMENVNEEEQMRAELQEIAYRFLEQKMSDTLPRVPEDIEYKIISMAMFTSALRASIVKDKYTQEQLAPIFKEVGTRLAKVFLKLCYGLCQYYQKGIVDEEIISLLREICLDTCPSIILNLVSKIHQECQETPDGTASINTLHKHLNCSKSTVFRIVADLELQNVLEKVSGEERVITKYKLTEEIKSLVDGGDIFKDTIKAKFYWTLKSRKKEPTLDT